MRASAKPAALFSALGDQTRLRIVARLADGPLSISKLTADSAITRQAVTKHLRVLERARVVHGARHGREMLWQLDRRRLEEARAYLDQISRQWDRALGRLHDLVED
jgi:DNA-binding transcriptional ArsR family regulator